MLRTNYIKIYYYTCLPYIKIYYMWPFLHKLIKLLSSKSNSSVQNISKFIFFANKAGSWVFNTISIIAVFVYFVNHLFRKFMILCLLLYCYKYAYILCTKCWIEIIALNCSILHVLGFGFYLLQGVNITCI